MFVMKRYQSVSTKKKSLFDLKSYGKIVITQKDDNKKAPSN